MLNLSGYRNEFTTMQPNPEISHAIQTAIDSWQKIRLGCDPVADLQQVVEKMRKMATGAPRNQCMNTFVRTLGEPGTLATWLDILRHTYHQNNTAGQKICQILQSYKRHSHYGHCQLLMLVSERHLTEAITPTSARVSANQTKHAQQWDMTLSIWQPLATGTSFASAKRSEPHLLVEPAHTHPFDFVSKVVIGTMYQSTYRSTTKEVSSGSKGRYAGVSLTRVDRTWPPHQYRKQAWLETLEDRVPLQAGDSYFLPSDLIHDVEMDLTISFNQPTITLMLSAESTVSADVYLEPVMLDFHDANPNLKDADCEMPFETWNEILRDTSAYLRGASTLQLPRMSIKDSFLVH